MAESYVVIIAWSGVPVNRNTHETFSQLQSDLDIFRNQQKMQVMIDVGFRFFYNEFEVIYYDNRTTA